MGILGTASMLSLFDVILTVVGIYTVYSAFVMKKSGKPTNWLMGTTDLTRCKDLPGFVNYIYMKTVIFGLVVSAYGIVGCINNYVTPLGILNAVGIVVVLAGCVIYITLLNKGKKMFL